MNAPLDAPPLPPGAAVPPTSAARLTHLKVLDEDDDDPMLSAVNLVDVFLVLVVALLAAVATSSRQSAPATVRDAGAPDMEIVVTEQGREIRYKGSGSVSEGAGVRAGVAYRLNDGSIIYVPEEAAADADANTANGPAAEPGR